MPELEPVITWDYSKPFTLHLEPLATDIDGLHHVNNAVYVHWCEQVAWAHSKQLGLGIDDYQRLGRAMAIRRSEYEYLHPVFLADQLALSTWLTASDGKLTLERCFQLVRITDGSTLMRGRWELVCIELTSGRARRMPEEFAAYHAAVVKRQ